MKQAIIDLTAAVNRLAQAAEKLTEKGGKESSPLIPPTKKGPKKKAPQSACARACEEDAKLAGMFDEFWKAYPSACPRKSNKAKCLKKYLTLLKDAKNPSSLHKTILAGLDRWTRCIDWVEDDGKFIKAPLVWLNQRNWEDSPRAAAADAGCDTAAAADRLIADGIAEILAKEAAQ